MSPSIHGSVDADHPAFDTPIQWFRRGAAYTKSLLFQVFCASYAIFLYGQTAEDVYHLLLPCPSLTQQQGKHVRALRTGDVRPNV